MAALGIVQESDPGLRRPARRLTFRLHEIAAAAGIGEALIRYHFPAGKDEIIAELLQRPIQPRLDNVEKIEDLRAATGTSPETLLYTLAMLDARTLARAPHNLGALARQPEAYRQDVGAPFRAAQEELLATYTHLAGQVSDIVPTPHVEAPSSHFLGAILLQQVDGIVELRSEGVRFTPEVEASVAATSATPQARRHASAIAREYPERQIAAWTADLDGEPIGQAALTAADPLDDAARIWMRSPAAMSPPLPSRYASSSTRLGASTAPPANCFTPSKPTPPSTGSTSPSTSCSRTATPSASTKHAAAYESAHSPTTTATAPSNPPPSTP